MQGVSIHADASVVSSIFIQLQSSGIINQANVVAHQTTFLS